MGAGKSTVGLRLARELAWTFVDLDEEIVRAEQKSIADIFEAMGEPGFRELEHLTLAAALEHHNTVLALGGGAVETTANRQLLSGNSETLLVYLEAPLAELISRCELQYESGFAAARRPILERKSELAERFLRRQPLYKAAHWTIETAERDPDEIVRVILARWKKEAMGQP